MSLPKISGIYKIQSKIKPERIYIGSAKDTKQRQRHHLCYLRTNKHRNTKLQNHYNKYKESDLIFSVILGCNIEDLIIHEQYFIDAINPWFNICKVAGSSLGRKHSIESIRKMSEIKKGKVGVRNGWKLSEEDRKKLSDARKGIKFSIETRNRLSESHKGKKKSEETRKRMSDAKKGHLTSLETRNRISESNKKRYVKIQPS